MMTGKDKIQSKNPFRVPENYFAEADRKIIDATLGSKQVRRLPLMRSLKPFLAVAASLAILIVSGYLSRGLFHKTETSPDVLQIVYLTPEFLFDENDLSTLENNALLTGSFDEGSGLSNNEIIDYLVSEDIDISLIFEKL